MLATAALLLLLALVLADPVPRLLAGAVWPLRSPRAALALWQAIGLAAGLAAIGAGVVYGVTPLAGNLPHGLLELADNVLAGRPLRDLGWTHLLALLAAGALGLRLFTVLVVSLVRTLRVRRRHRDLVDLLATPWPDLGGARVLDHPAAVAYCLPGLRSRVVVSAGAIDALDREELAAVLAHERAHLAARHDLVVLPFVAWGAALPFAPGVRRAQAAVAMLVEMLADDRASARCGASVLASAIVRVGAHDVPEGSLAASGSVVVARVGRLLDRAETVERASGWVAAAAYAGSAALVLLPTALLLAPAL